jgi:hypothetical protein
MSFENFPKLLGWFQSLSTLKGWAEDFKGAESFGNMLKTMISEPF